MITTYKVGGCVRDKLLGIKSQDTDYVVVGATPQYMISQGFIPVGRHFPVFIDPITKNQYALARTERKTGVGYHGFEFYAAADITLEQDLKRRDITINAIAEDENGQLIDPFNGIDDLKRKIIRHISPAFAEDPLRVLRVARFKAKLGFCIADETLRLMQQLCTDNELEHLSAERIWDEVRKVLDSLHPIDFFMILNQVGALDHILHEFKIIINNQSILIKTIDDLNQALKLNYSSEEKLSIIISNISLINSQAAARIIKTCKLGHIYTELGYIINNNLELLLKLPQLDSENILRLIKNLDPSRRTKRFEQINRVLSITCPELQDLTRLQLAADNFEKLPYAQLTTLPDFVNEIRLAKLKIISNIFT